MPVMPTDASRLLLFAETARPAGSASVTKIRRFRLARLQPDAGRQAADEPRYAYLKRSYD